MDKRKLGLALVVFALLSLMVTAPAAKASPDDPAWNQTTWTGGRTTPSLQVGTWDNTYDNYYTGENENNADGENFRLALSSPRWWNVNWTYRRYITINGSHPENYQLRIVFDKVDNLNNHCLDNFQDLRFTENDNGPELSFWIESYISGDNAVFWTRRVENVDSGIYIYYGNSSAVSKSSWENTFVYYDNQVTSAAGWLRRYRHASVVFGDNMWVIGGSTGSARKDVWCSTDGATWVSKTSAASWTARYGHTSVVFNNKMWVIGGYDSTYDYKNDVWSSENGVTWVQENSAAAWGKRGFHTSVVFDGKIWVIGGTAGAATMDNDVWYSTDGKNWVQATAAAGWTGRYGHTSVVFDNKMWVIGGYINGSPYYMNDVWYSSDGVTWTRATAAAGWSRRYFHTSVVFDNKMWVIGGYGNTSPNYKNDVWYSSDGVTWTRATAAAGWSARMAQTSVVFNNKMWVIGGSTPSGYKNDVWYFVMKKIISPEPTSSAGIEETLPWVYCLSGYIESSIFDVRASADWKAISWNESKPAGTSIVVKARTGNDQSPYDGGWSDWYIHENNAENDSMPNSRYVQYRVELSTSDNTKTPVFRDITINYKLSPGPPTLVSPENGTDTNDNTLTFKWIIGAYADNHRLLVDNDSDFSSPEENQLLGADNDNYTIADENALPDDNYYWKVSAINTVGVYESAVWMFTLSKVPRQPMLISPEDGDAADNAPTFKWTIGRYADNHHLLVDTNSDFSSPEENQLLGADNDNYKIAAENSLLDGTYYWKVVAKNAWGDTTSPVWTFIVFKKLTTLHTQDWADFVYDSQATIAFDALPAEYMGNLDGSILSSAVAAPDYWRLDGADYDHTFTYVKYEAEKWLRLARDSYGNNNYEMAIYAMGVAAHYIGDAMNILHNDNVWLSDAAWRVQYPSGWSLHRHFEEQLKFYEPATPSPKNWRPTLDDYINNYLANYLNTFAKKTWVGSSESYWSYWLRTRGCELGKSCADNAAQLIYDAWYSLLYEKIGPASGEGGSGSVLLGETQDSGGDTVLARWSFSILSFGFGVALFIVVIFTRRTSLGINRRRHHLRKDQRGISSVVGGILVLSIVVVAGATMVTRWIPELELKNEMDHTDAVFDAWRNLQQAILNHENVKIEVKLAADPASILGLIEQAPSPGTITITPAKHIVRILPSNDAYIGERGSSGSDNLWVQSYEDNNRRAYLRFSLSSLPSDARIYEARLVVYAKISSFEHTVSGTTGYSPVSMSIAVMSVSNDDWFEDTISWANNPGYDNVLVNEDSPFENTWDISYEDDIGIWYTFNISSYVKGQRASGDDLISLCLKAPREDSTLERYAWFRSKESAGYCPNLQITYESVSENIVPENIEFHPWWDNNWIRKRPITITGSHPENYQLKIVVPYDSDMRSDYGDLRFLEDENTGVLNYWVENYTATQAIVWVKRQGNVDSTIYVYYGNPSASSVSNWENTILPYTDSQATDNAGWTRRYDHTSVVFDNKMWVIGGIDSTLYKNDVWYSSDGVTWTQVTAAAGWTGRYGHTSVVFDNKMWVIGGYDGTFPFKNDVWYSSDGENWTQATAAAGWTGRFIHTSVVFDNKMWVIGGFDSITFRKNDVWYSSDGVTWTQATAAAGWSARYAHTSVVFDNKMWVIGGYDSTLYKNDVWYSSDGVTWTQVTAAAGWTGRYSPTSVVFDNKMWVIGGIDSTLYKNDVWYSSDGVTWTQVTAAAGWTGRYGHTSVVFNDKMWVIGGFDSITFRKNDVWRLLRTYTSPEPTASGGNEQTLEDKWSGSYNLGSIADSGSIVFDVPNKRYDRYLFIFESGALIKDRYRENPISVTGQEGEQVIQQPYPSTGDPILVTNPPLVVGQQLSGDNVQIYVNRYRIMNRATYTGIGKAYLNITVRENTDFRREDNLDNIMVAVTSSYPQVWVGSDPLRGGGYLTDLAGTTRGELGSLDYLLGAGSSDWSDISVRDFYANAITIYGRKLAAGIKDIKYVERVYDVWIDITAA